MLESQKIRIAYRKANHLCQWCAEQDERTLAGKSYCIKCTQKRAENQHYRRMARRKNGLCTICGKKDSRTEHGERLCENCAEMERESKRRSLLKAAERKNLPT